MSDSMFDAATDCFMCQKKFQVFRRKHRCRSCGNAVCGSCARSHKVMPSTTIVRYNNEPVRVCDRCVHDQNQMQMERRRAEDVERLRARQLAVAEEEQRMRAAEDVRRDLEQAEQRARERSRLALQQRALEEKHLGVRPDRSQLRRTRSCDALSQHTPLYEPLGQHASLYSPLSRPAPLDGPLSRHVPLSELLRDAQRRAQTFDAFVRQPPPLMTLASSASTVVVEADECAICLDPMDVGDAIYTTACGHSFHWRCLQAIQTSDASNYDKCPSCRAVMSEMQVKQLCDHPRVRLNQRFCRDCGQPVTPRDVKPRASDATPQPQQQPMQQQAPRSRFAAPPPAASHGQQNQPMSYRASSHGALVRCPQCHIQMRVLPNMYNMRVACPSGHMFLVQVASDMHAAAGGGGGRGTYNNNAGRVGMGARMGGGAHRGGAMSGYPGAASSSSYYRQQHTYSEL